MSGSDLENHFGRLRRLLIKIKYAQPVDKKKIVGGETMELLPLLHYGLLSYSKLVATHISKNGYDLYGKNDLRFTEGVYILIRNEFNYKPILHCNQFLTDKGFAKAKIGLICDILDKVVSLHNKLTKKHLANEAMKVPWHETKLSQKISATIANQKKSQKSDKSSDKTQNKKKMSSALRNIKKSRKNTHSNTRNNPTPMSIIPSKLPIEVPTTIIATTESSCEMRDDLPQPTTTTIPSATQPSKHLHMDSDNEMESKETELPYTTPVSDTNNNDISPSSLAYLLNTHDSKPAEYNPESYAQYTDATMEISNPNTNPYLQSQSLVDPQSTLTTIPTLAIIAEETLNQSAIQSHHSSPDKNTGMANNSEQSSSRQSSQNRNIDPLPPISHDNNGNNDDNDSNDSHSEHKSNQSQSDINTKSVVSIIAQLQQLESHFSKHCQMVNARLIVIESKLRFLESQPHQRQQPSSPHSQPRQQQRQQQTTTHSNKPIISNIIGIDDSSKIINSGESKEAESESETDEMGSSAFVENTVGSSPIPVSLTVTSDTIGSILMPVSLTDSTAMPQPRQTVTSDTIGSITHSTAMTQPRQTVSGDTIGSISMPVSLTTVPTTSNYTTAALPQLPMQRSPHMSQSQQLSSNISNYGRIGGLPSHATIPTQPSSSAQHLSQMAQLQPNISNYGRNGGMPSHHTQPILQPPISPFIRRNGNHNNGGNNANIYQSYPSMQPTNHNLQSAMFIPSNPASVASSQQFMRYPISVSSNGGNPNHNNGNMVSPPLPTINVSDNGAMSYSTNDSMGVFMRSLQEKLDATDRLLESTKPQTISSNAQTSIL